MLPLALGPNRQQDHAARQQDELDEKNGRRQRKRRVQCPQGQGILGEEAPVPQPQRFRQGEPDKCEIQLAYAIGVAKPVSILVDSFGTGKVSDEKLAQLVEEHFDLRPAAIIRDLNLRRPIYRQLAAYGHFGRTDIDLPWEKTDKVEALKKSAGIL